MNTYIKTTYTNIYRSGKCLLSCAFVLSVMIASAQEGANKQNQNSTSDKAKIQQENDVYRLVTVPIPQGLPLEVGGMAFLPNDALAVCTRHGEVWIISNPYMKDGLPPQYKLFAHGLHESLGLTFVKGDLYVAQRSELTRLRDLDGDGVADEYETIYSWPLSGNYHEYSYGPMMDKNGNMIIALNLGWTGREESLSKWHGWMLELTPGGKMIPFATGFRSPAGMTLNNDGDIFYVENQGGWMGSGFIANVEKGDFLGHPEGLRWADQPDSPVKLRIGDIPDTGEPEFEVAKRVPGLKTPSVWLPHTILGISSSAVLNYNGRGKMGPFEGQMLIGDQGESKISRVFLEKVKGIYQGAAFPFRQGFSSGLIRMNWGSDGSMFVGMTSRGWGSTGPEPYGLQRLVYTGVTPFEIKAIRAQPDGFELEFTMPVNENSARNAASYDIHTFTYQYHHEYGSPTINVGPRNIKAISVSPDHLRVRLVLDSLKLGYIHEIKAEGIRSADNFSLMHNYGFYTLNRIPDGEKLSITADNRVTVMMAHEHSKMLTSKEKNTNANQAAIKVKTQKHVTKQPADWKNGPDRTIVLGTKPGLKFDLESINVKPGTKIKLTFNNVDDMLHNFVLTDIQSGNMVGELALKLGINGQRMNFVPASPKVLFHTLLLQPGKSETIFFKAPDKPGSYDYICTFPGHYLMMRGKLNVEK
ncbi:MAG: plastocyanin/azurin family copper-binding protein [Ginsengibacter sp.]